MLVNCKPGCKGKKATTNASLDIESNQVFCDFCQEELQVSSFTKNSMKQQGHILKKDNRKPFQFQCLTCKKIVGTELVNEQLKGLNCEKACKFNVSKFAILAIKNSQKIKIEEDVEDEDNQDESR